MWQYNLSSLSTQFLQKAKKKLVIDISKSKTKTFYAYGEFGGVIILPRFYECPVIPMPSPHACWRTTENMCWFHASTKFRGTLCSRPPQNEAAKIALHHLHGDHRRFGDSSFDMSPTTTFQGGTLSLRQGFGRMAISLWVASEIRMRTVIITHSEIKRDRWADAVRFFFPNGPASSPNDISILTQKDVFTFLERATREEMELFLSAGLVILDDVNSFDLSFFAKFLNLWTVKKLLGLTTSKKYHHPLVGWSVGNIIYDSDSRLVAHGSLFGDRQRNE